MSEPTTDLLKQVVDIFLRSYNELNHTNFSWNDDGSDLTKESQQIWIDASVFDGQHRLDIQYKEVIWDPKYDKERSGAADKIVRQLTQTMITQGLIEFAVHFNFYQAKIISSPKEIDNFCFWLAELIRLYSDDGYPGRHYHMLLGNSFRGKLLKTKISIAVFLKGIRQALYLALDKPKKVRQLIYRYESSDEMYLQNIESVVSYLTIFRNPGQTEPNIGWGYSEPQPRPLPRFGNRVVEVIKDKIASKYDNMIVLLDCNHPIDEYDLKEIENETPSFKSAAEIWIVENFLHEKKAIRIR